MVDRGNGVDRVNKVNRVDRVKVSQPYLLFSLSTLCPCPPNQAPRPNLSSEGLQMWLIAKEASSG